MKKILFILFLIVISGCAKTIVEEPPTVKDTKIEGGEIMANVLMVIAPKNFRDEEFLEPREIFENNGIKVTVASKNTVTSKGMLGATVNVDKDVSSVNVADYDAIVFIGGSGASVYFDDETVLSIAKQAHQQNKVIGAICIAPSILANAGILEGKSATAFSSESSNLESKGASYTGYSVTQDGKIITANGPVAASEFAQKIVNSLK